MCEHVVLGPGQYYGHHVAPLYSQRKRQSTFVQVVSLDSARESAIAAASMIFETAPADEINGRMPIVSRASHPAFSQERFAADCWQMIT